MVTERYLDLEGLADDARDGLLVGLDDVVVSWLEDLAGEPNAVALAARLGLPGLAVHELAPLAHAEPLDVARWWAETVWGRLLAVEDALQLLGA